MRSIRCTLYNRLACNDLDINHHTIHNKIYKRSQHLEIQLSKKINHHFSQVTDHWINARCGKYHVKLIVYGYPTQKHYQYSKTCPEWPLLYSRPPA